MMDILEMHKYFAYAQSLAPYPVSCIAGRAVPIRNSTRTSCAGGERDVHFCPCMLATISPVLQQSILCSIIIETRWSTFQTRYSVRRQYLHSVLHSVTGGYAHLIVHQTSPHAMRNSRMIEIRNIFPRHNAICQHRYKNKSYSKLVRASSCSRLLRSTGSSLISIPGPTDRPLREAGKT